MRILLVEPDRLLATNLAALFKRLGHRVAWAATAQAGLHAADEQLPDAVILEPQLALHDGVEFMHEFRSYPDWERVPAVIYSQRPVGNPASWRALGIGAFYDKANVSLRQLAEALEQLQTVQA